MPDANVRSNPPLPAELLRATPRDVRLNACGIFVAILALASAVGGLWGGAELYRRARLSERDVALFKSEAVPTQARVVRVQSVENGIGGKRESITSTSWTTRLTRGEQPCAAPPSTATPSALPHR